MLQKLYEGLSGAVPFMADRSHNFVTESRNGLVVTKIPGRFSICDSVNGNGRKYPEKVWEKNLAEGSQLKTAIKRNAAFGLLEHPKDGQISLNSPICILITDARIESGKDKDGKSIKEVLGEIMVLGTAEGQKLTALIDAGYNPLVSSRGFGSVLKDDQGIDVVQEDYICEGWDVVMKPSFETAELWPSREEKKEEGAPAAKTEKALAEEKISAAAPAAASALKEASTPSPAPAPASASASKPLTETIMDITTLKSRIGSLRSDKVPTEPQRFAEGMNEMAQLHQEIANFVAEDAKRTWQGQQLHDSLCAVEKTWSESAMAPSKTAIKLSESYRKALRVTKAIGEAACNFKKKLGEALRQNSEAAALIEEITQRGKAWVALADKRKATIEELDHKVNVACEALEIMAKRYHEDVTDLGRRVITLEFGPKAQTESIQKLLKEATHPKDVLAIREQLEGKKDEKAKEEGKKDESAKAPVAESKKESGAPAPEVKSAESLSEARVLVPSLRSVTESVDMVKRLSASNAK